MMKLAFRLINRVYRKLIRIAVRNGDSEALLEAPGELLPESVLHRRSAFPEELGASFHSEISSHSRIWHAHPERSDLPEWALDNKLNAYKLMAELGVRTPKVFQRDVKLDDLEFVSGSVLKPEEAFQSRGVFVVGGNNLAYQVASDTPNLSEQDVRGMANGLLKSGAILKDLWQREEAILGENGLPAPDVKFYCFYGSCAMVLIRDIHPGLGLKFQCRGRQGEILVSKSHKPSDLSYVHVGEEDFAIAEEISRSLPTPFLRLDFFQGEELVFGEIGNLVGYFADFGVQVDRLMGAEFAKARGRLFDDLRRGKSFPAFDRVLANQSSGTHQ